MDRRYINALVEEEIKYVNEDKFCYKLSREQALKLSEMLTNAWDLEGNFEDDTLKLVFTEVHK